jgi:hypothetical protein
LRRWAANDDVLRSFAGHDRPGGLRFTTRCRIHEQRKRYQLAKLSPNYQDSSSLLGRARDFLIQDHYSQGIRLYREEKLEGAIAEWRTVLQYDPNHAAAKKNIEQAERLLQGLQQRQQKK